MSRTFRRDERTGRRPEDARRNKRRQKANSHYSDTLDDYQDWSNTRGRKVNNYSKYFDLDTDTD